MLRELGRPGNFTGEENILALTRCFKPTTNDAFCLAPGLGRARDGIELGGVESVYAALNGIVHLGVAFGFSILLAPGHGAEGDLGNLKAGSAERVIAH